ncbi:MAG: hypothetical protein IJ552_11665 [Prevotella sp.]|nr:hypothetical protein [Prevotella sp.]
MSNYEKLLAKIASEVNAAADARDIYDQLTKQAKEGDTDSVKLLAELNQYAEERKLRKELFGI